MSVQSSSCDCACMKSKWLLIYGGVAHQNSPKNIVSSNSFCVYKEAAAESTGGFQRSGESSEILAIHVNSIYIYIWGEESHVFFIFLFCRKAECAVPIGENLLVDMSCTGKDRVSHLAGMLRMCLGPWKIASLIGFFSCCFLTILNLSLCRELRIWKMSKKD